MLHNNNQFVPSDVPISAEANLTSDIINPNNVNSIKNITQPMPLPANSGCSISEFPYGLNMNAGMSQYPNFSSVGFPHNVMSQNSMNWPNNTFPMNLNAPNGPFGMSVDRKTYEKEVNLLNVPQIPKYKPDAHVNNYAHYNDNLFSNQNYRPVHASYDDDTTNKHRIAGDYKQYFESNLGLSGKVVENDCNLSKISKPNENCLQKDVINKVKETLTMEPDSCISSNPVTDVEKNLTETHPSDTDTFSLRTFKDSDSRKRSLEKTLRMLEISIINSTNSRKIAETTESPRNHTDTFKTPTDNAIDTSDPYSDTEQNEELSSESQYLNSTLVETKNQEKTKPEASKQTSDDEQFNDLLPVNKIKQETVHTVEVKLEEWTPDLDTPNPFQKDTFGVPSEHVYNCHILDSENSVNIAKELAKDGGTTESYFECPYCSLYFNNPKRYLIHIKWHSFGLTNEKRLELQREKEMKKVLKKQARIQIKKQNEEKKEHEGPNKCTICDKEFNTYSSLKTHRQKMHPTRARTCKICSKNVLGWLAMKQHMTTHEEASFNCPDCPKRFKHAHSLAKHRDTHKAHERTHRNEKPFTCDICNSSFGTNSSLKRHLKVSHNTTKPYECRTCHRCFMQESIRDRHELRLHSNPEDFKYPCKLCTSKFIEMKDLKKHLYKVHPKVKRKKHSDDDYSE
ncbi:zinc finger protein 26-like isoform X2 [Pieris napi]|uniref:zinc finger protein 26-like isoform X2 n=1 Tax=Pieris napi TaxID=78633 RepID=UPI001FBB9F6B|nr:zinc finger protein 26-like isoform X2 [Pieris napi]